jgi:enoyl-CoA hydratase/carnithine racemase
MNISNQFIHVQYVDQIAILALTKGVTNAIEGVLVDQLAVTLEVAENDPNVRGVVLASANDKFFSIGFDIPQLYQLPPDEFAIFYRAFNRLCLDLYTLPKPTAAAITGHATAGGCILALCCDYRMVAQGHKLMGLNEIKLGVPVPYVADRILRQLVGQRNARDIIDTGAFYNPEQSLDLGLIDQVLPLADVIPAAIEKVHGLGSHPSKAFAEIKRYHTGHVSQEAEPRLDETDRTFIDCWYTDKTRHHLREAMSKF